MLALGHALCGEAYALAATAFVHFVTSLPDLVEDNKAGTRHLPLRVALKTGAPKLMVVSLVATVAVVAALIYKALTVGIAY